MKKIIIGCLYGGHSGLKKALLKKLKKGDLLVDIKDISAIDFKNVYVEKHFQKHPIESFTSAFIRYPYDLIPPHTNTYNKREYTEFFKTAALLFIHKSINRIDANFNARNRLYSLKTAKLCGLNVPKSVVVSKKRYNLKSVGTHTITKSLGNCFYSYDISEKLNSTKKNILSYERDGSENAYIYLPHKIKSVGELNKHIHSFGITMAQEFLSGDEYRIYMIKNKIFSYKRGINPKLDKSFSVLENIQYKFTKSDTKKLKFLKQKLNLNYLCLDIIDTKKGMYVIDINPFGSLPEYHLHPGATDKLAELIVSKK